LESESTLTEVARALNAAHPMGLAAGGGLPPLFFFTDDVRTPDPLAAIKKLPEGCGVVFRQYEAEDRAELAARIVAACRMDARMCLVAGGPALAAEVGADGIHLPEHMLRELTERPDASHVTTAAHDKEAIAHAERLAIDAVFVSPVFASESHPGRKSLGAAQFNQLVAATQVPAYALGGITNANARDLERSGATGLAAIGALLKR